MTCSRSYSQQGQSQAQASAIPRSATTPCGWVEKQSSQLQPPQQEVFPSKTVPQDEGGLPPASRRRCFLGSCSMTSRGIYAESYLRVKGGNFRTNRSPWGFYHHFPWRTLLQRLLHETFLFRNSVRFGRMFAERWRSFDKGWSSPKQEHLSVAGLYLVSFPPMELQALLLLCLPSSLDLMLAVYMCTAKASLQKDYPSSLCAHFLGLCFRIQELKPKE